MWINGQALNEISTAILREEAAKAFAAADYAWSNAIREEIEFRDRHPEYHI